ncbi:MAG: aldolase/citrate lyase family protein [Rhizobium sp.]|uniref:HpcH/HpaI aldolase family protein n=1 Tax=Rhizobium sp. SYY.PMSO TaxID=3382192 RepID=UPI000DE55168
MSETLQTTRVNFRQRLLAKERLLGSFIKTPTAHSVEILGDIGFDFVVIDEEHAPFDRTAIDVAVLAARATGTAALVRVSSEATILSALDCGADGILVPHVANVAKARSVASASRYRNGTRGYSPSGRSGRYGGDVSWPYIDRSDARVATIAMIEDPSALEDIDAIVAVDGIDAFFVGRGDLTLALNAQSTSSDEVTAAVTRVTSAAGAVGKPVAVMAATRTEGDAFAAVGATAFILSSDQGFIRKAGLQMLESFRD